MGVVQCEVVPSLNLSREGFMAAKGDIGDSGSYTIIIKVELEDISNSNTTNTIDNDVEFV